MVALLDILFWLGRILLVGEEEISWPLRSRRLRGLEEIFLGEGQY